MGCEPSIAALANTRLLGAPAVTAYALEPALMRRALELGTVERLRAGDAIYAAVAERAAGRLVAWDEELLARADAVRPDEWMEQAGSSR